MAFHVGQKVVCVEGALGNCGRGVREPVKGDVATVCNVYHDHDGECILELIEFPAPGSVLFHPGWLAEFFRPLIERKQSTSTGFEILDDIRKRETVSDPVKIKIGCGND